MVSIRYGIRPSPSGCRFQTLRYRKADFPVPGFPGACHSSVDSAPRAQGPLPPESASRGGSASNSPASERLVRGLTQRREAHGNKFPSDSRPSGGLPCRREGNRRDRRDARCVDLPRGILEELHDNRRVTPTGACVVPFIRKFEKGRSAEGGGDATSLFSRRSVIELASQDQRGNVAAHRCRH